jgi:hypothetical protein
MTATSAIDHTAVFVRFDNAHYHQQCIPHYVALQEESVVLDMDNRKNIAQTVHIPCAVCKQPINLFADRKEMVLEEWPNTMIRTPEQAAQYAQAALDKLFVPSPFPGKDAHQTYRILHTWVENPQGDNQPGRISAICEVEMEKEEQQQQPAFPFAPSADHEKFTPGPWHHATGLVVFQGESTFVAAALHAEDAWLIDEAPSMFALLKEYVKSHVDPNDGTACKCMECEATRALFKRVVWEG